MINRKIYLFILIVFLSQVIWGEEAAPVGQKSKVDISLNGGLTMKFSDLGRNNGFAGKDTNFAYLLGFKAAVVFNKSWYIGGAGYFLGNDISYHCKEIASYNNSYGDAPCIDYKYDGEIESDLSFGYGGLIAGHTFNVKSYFRVETGVLIGGGQFSAIGDYGGYFFKQNVFALEPEINFLFLITRFLAASVNISYRLITGMENDSAYSTADMSGPSAGLDIRFGSF